MFFLYSPLLFYFLIEIVGDIIEDDRDDEEEYGEEIYDYDE